MLIDGKSHENVKRRKISKENEKSTARKRQQQNMDQDAIDSHDFLDEYQRILVTHSFDKESFILKLADNGVPFGHADECPFEELKKPENQKLYETNMVDPKIKEVRLAVTVLITSKDDHVMLTKRALHMRTFPGLWVPTGGGIDEGETPMEAAAREIQEEVGIALTPEQIAKIDLIGFWESAFPTYLDEGFPIRHHVVLYHVIQLEYNHDDEWVEKGLKIDPNEVDRICWVKKEAVKRYLSYLHRENFDKFLRAEEATTENHNNEEVREGDNRMSLGTEFVLR